MCGTTPARSKCGLRRSERRSYGMGGVPASSRAHCTAGSTDAHPRTAYCVTLVVCFLGQLCIPLYRLLPSCWPRLCWSRRQRRLAGTPSLRHLLIQFPLLTLLCAALVYIACPRAAFCCIYHRHAGRSPLNEILLDVLHRPWAVGRACRQHRLSRPQQSAWQLVGPAAKVRGRSGRRQE